VLRIGSIWTLLPDVLVSKNEDLFLFVAGEKRLKFEVKMYNDKLCTYLKASRLVDSQISILTGAFLLLHRSMIPLITSYGIAVIVNRLTHKSTQKRQRKRERRHARCTLHSDGRPARPDFDQREKSFASCALKIEEEEEEETAPPLRAAGRSSRFWTVESTPPRPSSSSFSASNTVLARSLSALSLVLL